MNIKNTILFRVRLSFLGVVIFAIAIVYKISIIQFVEGEKWRSVAEKIGLQYRAVEATRGNIISDNGSLLATSLPFYKLALDPSRASDEIFKSDIDSLSLLLSDFYDDNSKDAYKHKIMDARKFGRKYIQLNRRLINYQDKKSMEQWPLLRNGRMNGGVLFEKVDTRFKPFNHLALRTIGFVNENGNGAGLEYSFNKHLAGMAGKSLYRKTTGGSWKPIPDASEVRPINGYDVQTTIDINLQDVTEAALLKSLESHQADYGCVVVMEVKTGEIKAISNLARNRNGTYGERYNYAVGSQGLREPGSTFKLATMIALFEETNLKLTDTVETGNGNYQIYDNTITDHEEGGYGTLSVKEAFEVSSNIAMAKMADKHFGLKPKKFYEYLEDLGLTKPLGFHMVGEGVPKVNKPEEWSGITLSWMAHGYGLEITPLHTLTLYNAVANNGKMVKPIIVKEVINIDERIDEFKSVTVNNQICSEATLAKLKALLEGVVKNGTAKNISNADYKIAGKTGTAQTLKNGKYQKEYMTSFAGYFPANAPQYSIIVVIEDPKGIYQFGSNVAAPVFKEIADKIYARNIQMHAPIAQNFERPIGIFPLIRSGKKDDLRMICNTLGVSNHTEAVEEEWVKTRIKDNAVIWKGNALRSGVTPDVIGMTLRDAIYMLEISGYQVRTNGVGRVKKQSILPGVKLTKGDKINIELG